MILNHRSSLQSGFLQECYIVDQRYWQQRRKTIGAVGSSTDFESLQQPTAQIHQNSLITSRKRKEKKILLASKSGAHVK
jgi:hypothetical protein